MVPIVGQYFRGQEANKLLESTGTGGWVVIRPNRYNPHDPDAHEVYASDGGALKHVAFVQRHFAARIAGLKKIQSVSPFSDLAGLLRNEYDDPNKYEVEIVGRIDNMDEFIKSHMTPSTSTKK